MVSRKSIVLVGFLILSLFSCNLFEGSPSDQDKLSTDVAATLMEESASTEASSITETPPPTASIPASDTPPSPPIFKITYTDAGNVWLIEGRNPPQQLTSSGFAEKVLISADGLKIAFIRRPSQGDLAELWVINADGSGEILLLSTEDMRSLYQPSPESMGYEISQLAFLPGSHDLIFNTYEAFATIGLTMTEDLLRINTENGDLTRLLTPNNGGNFAISPDGDRIAVVQPDRIRLVNPDGSGLSSDLITYPLVITYSEFQYHAQPVWSRDSRAVGFAIPSNDPLGENPSGDIWRIPKDGSATVNITTIPGDFYFSQVFSSPTLSPLLDRVAFTRETATPNIRELYIANADGSAETIYDTGQISWYGWAPDGIHFVYSLSDPMTLQIGSIGEVPSTLATGTALRWVNQRDFLYLEGSMGAWTLIKGSIGTAPIPLATPAGDFISFDFNRIP